MKKKILVVVSLLIVVAMLTTGAFAYFTTLNSDSSREYSIW